jgi:glycosyltransferase involved in cell wall biosynthesis
MRIAVQPHAFHLGGSQLNAVELARAVRDRGHEVFVIGDAGPITEMAADFGLRLLALPAGVRRPSPVVVRELRRWCARLDLDVIHGYEWPPVVEGWAAGVGSRVTCVGTIYSMDVAPFLPQGVDLVVGTHEIAARARARGLGPLHVVEPPVDTHANHPGVAGSELRHRLGIPDDQIVISLVSRLAPALKLEGILGAIGAVGAFGRTWDRPPPTLLIAGDGSARAEVEAAAAAVNRRSRGAIVRVVGHMPDPRAAYDAADICLGMGGSALRALAFGKPLVVQGERGFWKTLTPETHPMFAWSGWYGVGDGGSSADALAGELSPLLANVERRAELGRYGLELVRKQYSLETAADRLIAIYQAANAQAGRRSGQLLRVTGGVFAHKARGRLARKLGRGFTEDYNRVTRDSAMTPPADWRPPTAQRSTVP